jgi:hypothetical protein
MPVAVQAIDVGIEADTLSFRCDPFARDVALDPGRASALYASQPLSPMATQHSLPSGRYSLLGPNLHRLDRTSFRLAHSLDHLVGTRDEARWNVEGDRYRCADENNK